MTRKIIFTTPFYHACGAQPLYLLGVSQIGGHKVGGHSCATYIFPHDIPPFPDHLTYDLKKERENRETDLERPRCSG
jgi:hypothetical protein